MNKTEYIEALSKSADVTIEQAELVDEILESRNVLRKKNEPLFVAEISKKLNVDNVRAKEIYDAGYGLIGSGIVNKVKHPFRSLD